MIKKMHKNVQVNMLKILNFKNVKIYFNDDF